MQTDLINSIEKIISEQKAHKLIKKYNHKDINNNKMIDLQYRTACNFFLLSHIYSYILDDADKAEENLNKAERKMYYFNKQLINN